MAADYEYKLIGLVDDSGTWEGRLNAAALEGFRWVGSIGPFGPVGVPAHIVMERPRPSDVGTPVIVPGE